MGILRLAHSVVWNVHTSAKTMRLGPVMANLPVKARRQVNRADGIASIHVRQTEHWNETLSSGSFDDSVWAVHTDSPS